MTRLDAYLVETGLFGSRARAKRAVKEGRVTVDGRTVIKPSAPVPPHARVEVRGAADLPAGYRKLASIQVRYPLVFPGARVLDVGTSAGGFALWCLEAGCALTCLEASPEFAPALAELAARGARTFQMNAFHPDLAALGGPFDLLLWDVTAEPRASLAAMAAFLPLLVPGGKVLFVAKGAVPGGDAAATAWVGGVLPGGWGVAEALPSRLREAYVIISPAVNSGPMHPDGGAAGVDEEVLDVLARALAEREEGEPVEYAVLRACRELHRPDHMEWFVRAMAPVLVRARERGEGWERAALGLVGASGQEVRAGGGGENPASGAGEGGRESGGERYASLKDVPEPLRDEIRERLNRGRRGAGQGRN